MKKVVLFGAGQVGAMTARLLGPDYMIVGAEDTSPEKWEWIKDMVLLILYYEIYKRRHSGRKGFIKF